PCGAGTLAQPGEEANGDAHGASIAAVRTLTVDARSPLADGARGSAGAPGGPRRATREPSAHREALRGLPRPPLRGPRADRVRGGARRRARLLAQGDPEPRDSRARHDAPLAPRGRHD